MSGVLVYSDRDDLAHDLSAWAAAQREVLGEPTAAVLGARAAERAEACRAYGAVRIHVCDAPAVTDLLDDAVAGVLAELVTREQISVVLIGATRRGRSLAPRLAQMLEAGCVSEAVELGLEGGRIVTGRYSLGGNTISREWVRTPIQIIAVAPGTVERAVPGAVGGDLITFEGQVNASRAAVIERRDKPGLETNIADSERLVCVGRGLASEEDLPLVQDLAEALGGEVACTRPLSYEYGWLPEERMIGISGQKCSPKLLVSIGVSGQVQHTVGIQGAKTIVAINTEKGAPIFKQADYGIVGDMYKVVPLLTARLRGRRGGGAAMKASQPQE